MCVSFWYNKQYDIILPMLFIIELRKRESLNGVNCVNVDVNEDMYWSIMGNVMSVIDGIEIKRLHNNEPIVMDVATFSMYCVCSLEGRSDDTICCSCCCCGGVNKLISDCSMEGISIVFEMKLSG